MTDHSFVIGQRWVSNSEADLGLGIIKKMEGRQLALFYPAANESRTYAADNAPLSRVIYQLGDSVRCADQRQFIIEHRHLINGCFVYQGSDSQGELISVHEMDLDAHVHFSQPQDRLLAGQIDKNSQFKLRIQALSHQHRLQQSPLLGLLGGRVQLLPHQLYIANEVCQRYAPRVLLADEVGLGKTIEAGLIVHQQLLSERAQRILIVVPDSLLHQWLVEMLRRFNLRFSIIDQAQHAELTALDEGNPFDSAQLVLVTLSDLVNHADIAADALAAQWDLMIVDEAHHLHWTPDAASDEYQLIERLAQQIRGLLLLTATPEQLGIEGHFARLRLLDADRYFDLQEFRAEQQQYQQVSALLQSLLLIEDVASMEADLSLQQQLRSYLGDAGIESLLGAGDFVQQRDMAVKSLLDQQGTGRILFRNTRDVVHGFPQRHLHRYPLQLPTTVEGQTTEQPLLPETLWDEDWLQHDRRVGWLSDWLKQHRGSKVLLICAQAETAQQLETCLRINHGIRSSVFHEQMSLVNRDRAAAYFAEEEEGAQLLICSEIGSEGRNFQFAHHLILFDLPLLPDLLEQRIGRLDRIGQHDDIHIHLPYYLASAQAVLADWYDQGMNAFERVMPAGEVIYQHTAEQLQASLNAPNNDKLKNELIDKTQQVTSDTLQNLQQGRDRLLEMNSFNETRAATLVAELEESTRALELADFMDEVFDQFGVDQQPHSADSTIIQPGNHMLHHQFPALAEEGVTATYQRHKALAREDMAFLTWEHPMVTGAFDLLINSDFGNSAFSTLELSDFPAGSLLLEAIFTLHCPAPKHLQINRYLNHSYLRVLVDEQGNDHADNMDEAFVNQHRGRIPRATAQQLVSHAHDKISQLIRHAKKRALAYQPELITAAKDAADKQLQEEINRLQALSQVNPNIRQLEIDYLLDAQQQLSKYIAAAELTLDALMVAIVTEPSSK